jgi:L-ascorbate metabolism protein UlaG (beta-lactamase superfamily)
MNRAILFKIYIIIILGFVGCSTFSVPGYKGKVSDHFDGKRFYNLDIDSLHQRSFWDMLLWNFTREKGDWDIWTDAEPGMPPPKKIAKGELRITFINHSTVLIQYDSLNILTDPIWSKTASPVSFLGTSRYRPPGLRFEDLPHIDYVLISHNHYDHLDLSTLIMLKKYHDPVFLVPLGNKDLLIENGIDKIFEQDWWEEYSPAKITLVPARHFSMRGLMDGNNTLWGGFVLKTEGGPVYFAGDTGFGKHFEMIYRKFGPMRFSMIPIGSFIPRWFMSYVHISPEEAVKAHKILHSKKTMGIHLGTISQADDGEYEPAYYLHEALRKENIPFDEFIIMPEGDGLKVK